MIKTKQIKMLGKLTREERTRIEQINEENLVRNGGSLGLSDILHYFKKGDIVLLAYNDDNEVVGYALIKKPSIAGIGFMQCCAGEIDNPNYNWRDIVANENALYIAQIAIARDYQGKGVATAMIESMNDCVVISNAKTENTGSHKMHMKNGFKVIGGMYNRDNELYDRLYYRDKKCV